MTLRIATTAKSAIPQALRRARRRLPRPGREGKGSSVPFPLKGAFVVT
jgi:hypothetical protein